MTKYLIIGTGGVGGSIAGFLALAGNDVTCIARGEHLRAIRENGLHLKSGLKGNHLVKVKACTADEYNDIADVIFVCVKHYSLDSIKDILTRASNEDTLILPILNIYNTGDKISTLVPSIKVLDGCIYIVGFVSGAGEITQLGSVFRLIFGARRSDDIPAERLNEIATTLRDAGIKVEISDDISRSTFIKWSFISAMACTGAYYDVPMSALQKQGNERDTFVGLSRESIEIGIKLGVNLHEGIEELVAAHLNVIDKLDPQSTASMQKDIARNHDSEINGLLFDMIRLGKSVSVGMPTYEMVSQKFL
ncbi:MAG: ketopantoate reductase family protein [Muribaculaceae bacterium]